MTEGAPPANPRLHALGLLFAPALTVIAAVLAPRVAVSAAAADALAFAGGAGVGLLALALAARADASRRFAVAVAVGGVVLIGVAWLGRSHAVVALALVNLGLVAIAHAGGGAIGRRVAHPGHLLPACAVAAAADLASVLHPSGPSHAIASSGRALQFLTVGFPVPGTDAVAPALGVGDLVFLALVFGVAVSHRLSVVRVAVAAGVGVAVAGGVAAGLGMAVPALIPIGVAVVAGVPEVRRLRAEDRRTATVAVALAAAVVVGVLVSPR